MTTGRIVIITGTPATGKSTVSTMLAANSDLTTSVHMHTDDFYQYIKKGAIPPYLPEAHAQNKVVIEAFLAATKVFADNGYEVIVDGIIGPWFLEPWLAVAKENYEIHYIVLRATKAETFNRAINRTKLNQNTNIELVETMWQQFTDLGHYESHVMDTTALSIEETADAVREIIIKKFACL